MKRPCLRRIVDLVMAFSHLPSTGKPCLRIEAQQAWIKACWVETKGSKHRTYPQWQPESTRIHTPLYRCIWHVRCNNDATPRHEHSPFTLRSRLVPELKLAHRRTRNQSHEAVHCRPSEPWCGTCVKVGAQQTPEGTGALCHNIAPFSIGTNSIDAHCQVACNSKSCQSAQSAGEEYLTMRSRGPIEQIWAMSGKADEHQSGYWAWRDHPNCLECGKPASTSNLKHCQEVSGQCTMLCAGWGTKRFEPTGPDTVDPGSVPSEVGQRLGPSISLMKWPEMFGIFRKIFRNFWAIPWFRNVWNISLIKNIAKHCQTLPIRAKLWEKNERSRHEQPQQHLELHESQPGPVRAMQVENCFKTWNCFHPFNWHEVDLTI